MYNVRHTLFKYTMRIKRCSSYTRPLRKIILTLMINKCLRNKLLSSSFNNEKKLYCKFYSQLWLWGLWMPVRACEWMFTYSKLFAIVRGVPVNVLSILINIPLNIIVLSFWWYIWKLLSTVYPIPYPNPYVQWTLFMVQFA